MAEEVVQTGGKSVRVSERTYEKLERMKTKDETFDILIARIADQAEEQKALWEATKSVDRLMEVGYFPFGDAHKELLKGLFSESMKLGNDVRCVTKIDANLYSNVFPGKKNSFVFYKHHMPLFKFSTVEGGFYFYKPTQKSEVPDPVWQSRQLFESESEAARNYVIEQIRKEIGITYRDASA